ncbi:MAG: ankyrin repeat domain-containing protein [Pseudomonadota bacterium]|nr:ankyrin repeat domain-containing protein [Pseudomonadota bacterium]
MLLSGVQRFFQNQLHQNTHFNSETLSAIKSISPTSSRIASVTNLPSLAATPTAIKIQDINDTLQAEVGYRTRLLIKAAKDGLLKAAQAAYRLGAQTDAFFQGKTPLHYAIENGHEEIVHFLLETCHVDANIKDENGLTPVQHALKAQNQHLIPLLQKHGAQVPKAKQFAQEALHFKNATAARSITKANNIHMYDVIDKSKPLFAAIAKGDTRMVKHMLSIGFSHLQYNKELERTPLEHAVISKQPELVTLLLEHGAEIEHPYSKPKSAINAAIQSDNREALTQILEHMQHQKLPLKATFLFDAIDADKPEIIDIFIKHGFSQSTQDKWNTTAFDYAIQNDKPNALAYFIQKDQLNIDTLNPKSGLTLLESTIKYKSNNCFLFLLKNGAKLTNPATEKTALHTAAELGHARYIPVLLKAGVPLNAQDKSGETALWKACQFNHIETLHSLLQHKANPDITDFNLVSPLAIAALSSARIAVFNRLLKASPNLITASAVGLTPLLASLTGHNKKAFDLLYDQLSLSDRNTLLNNQALSPALHTAAAVNNAHALLKMIPEAQNIDLKNTFNQTPLTCAIENNAYDAARVLLKRGAQVSGFRTGTSQTPLSLAIHKGHLKMVKLLAEHDITLSSNPYYKASLIEKAKQQHLPDIQRFLETYDLPADHIPSIDISDLDAITPQPCRSPNPFIEHYISR